MTPPDGSGSISMQPVRRDIQFGLDPAKVNTWHPMGTHVATFFNSMSVFFPVGERFFIRSVRHYRDRIDDPDLEKAVAAFIGQEAMHGREHEEYNRLLAKAGLPIEPEERAVIRLIERTSKLGDAAVHLGATIALEHLTAILADMVLRDERTLGGADQRYADLWRWHALEETEHKAVAFDVFRAVLGNSLRAYLIRVITFLSSSFLFWSYLAVFYIRNLHAQGQLWNLRGWGQLLKFQWINPGALRRVIPAWFAYFKPGFHPWKHDNREYLAQIGPIAERYGG